MAIEDVIPTIVVIGVIYLIFRWFNKPREGAQSATPAGIRGVTRSMVETVQSAFPDIPPPNIVYSLSRTRSAQATSEEILERGYLPAPPASFNIPPSLLPEQAPTQAPVTPVKASSTTTQRQTLIDRYNLNARLPSVKGKEKEEVPVASSVAAQGRDVKGEWADTKDKRERELRERKERMILEARRRMLEKQAKEATAGDV